MRGRRPARSGLIGDPGTSRHGDEALWLKVQLTVGDALVHHHEVPAEQKGEKPAANYSFDVYRVDYPK